MAGETWDILNKYMTAWDANDGESYNKAWSLSKPSNVPASVVTQQSGYVNIKKMLVGASNSNYAFLVPPAMTLSSASAYTVEVKAKMNAIDKTEYPDLENGGFESNHISARMNGKIIAITLKYGADGDGYISLFSAVSHSNADKYILNTAEWHTYRFVLHAGSAAFDVYVDDMEDPVWENIPTTAMSGSNILRLGAETNQRCNMDIEYAKVATGDLNSKPKIVSVEVAADSHIVNHERSVKVTLNTALTGDGEKALISLVDETDTEVMEAVEVTIQSNKASRTITIPATLSIGKYHVKASALNGQFGTANVTPKTVQYNVVDVSPFDIKLLPDVSPVGFVREIDDYQYKGVSNEFIFPSILDTKKYTEEGIFLNGESVLDRYYLFYTPHEVPGGMYLATAPTLDGPWTERNTVIDINWAKAVNGSIVNTADHISSCQVVWNDVYKKYFMYFHGPNSTTHYAVSDNLKDWTFGKSILNPQSFGSRGNEASYAKVFEHTIPGINNKYILMLMINENNVRKIFSAYSQDGIDWVCNRKPLVSPDLDYKKIPGTIKKPNYAGSMGNNVSGPFFMESEGRYFVFCNGSSGNMFIVEVGELLDMEIHWGEYMKQEDVVIDTDIDGKKIAVPRIAAPDFITDDNGIRYMFFEAGGRLGANIAYAKESKQEVGINRPSFSGQLVITPNLVKKGRMMTVRIPSGNKSSDRGYLEIINAFGSKVYSADFSGNEISIPAPLHSGMYIIRILRGNRIVDKSKFIVK
jgi:hypothetical protein